MVILPPVNPVPALTWVTVPVFAVLLAARSYAVLTAFDDAATVEEVLFVASLNVGIVGLLLRSL